jgi:hypothetical protein
MATTIQNTQEVFVALEQVVPNVMDTQECLVILVKGTTFNFQPTLFNLQKLVLTVKESNLPARGRNK